MRAHRLVSILVVVFAFAGFGTVARRTPEVVAPTFTVLGDPTMPFVPSGSFITSSWFCPGVPTGAEGLGGNVVITNTGDEPIRGRLSVFTSAEGVAAVSASITVDARTSDCLLYTSPSPRDGLLSRMPSSA